MGNGYLFIKLGLWLSGVISALHALIYPQSFEEIGVSDYSIILIIQATDRNSTSETLGISIQWTVPGSARTEVQSQNPGKCYRSVGSTTQNLPC